MTIIVQPDENVDEVIARYQRDYPEATLFVVRIIDPIRPTVDDIGHA